MTKTNRYSTNAIQLGEMLAHSARFAKFCSTEGYFDTKAHVFRYFVDYDLLKWPLAHIHIGELSDSSISAAGAGGRLYRVTGELVLSFEKEITDVDQLNAEAIDIFLDECAEIFDDLKKSNVPGGTVDITNVELIGLEVNAPEEEVNEADGEPVRSPYLRLNWAISHGVGS